MEHYQNGSLRSLESLLSCAWLFVLEYASLRLRDSKVSGPCFHLDLDDDLSALSVTWNPFQETTGAHKLLFPGKNIYATSISMRKLQMRTSSREQRF